MIIYCKFCESKVDANEQGSYDYSDDDLECPVKVTLCSCPVCQYPIIISQELDYDPDERSTSWTNPIVIWPSTKDISYYIPDIVRGSLEEARKCLDAKAYSACAVMCGRALEAIGVDHKVKSRFIAGGLKELLDKKVIDNRLYEWGQELRMHRNTGAHASDILISKEDASDLLDFAVAICDYVYVLIN